MKNFMTNEQKVVVESREKRGYTVIGEGVSSINGLKTIIITKGRHRVDINTLGYDEFIQNS